MMRIGKAVFFGVCLGLVLVLIQSSFQIQEDVFMQGYWIAAIVVVLGMLIINISYNLYYIGKVKKLLNLLYAGDSRGYIEGMEALRKSAKGKTLRSTLELNLAAGYMEEKDYGTAISLLEAVDPKQLRVDSARVVRAINLCESYFLAGQREKAQTLYDSTRPLFAKFRTGKAYGGSIAIVDVLEKISLGEFEQAKALLDKAKSTYKEAYLQKAYEEIGAILEKSQE